MKKLLLSSLISVLLVGCGGGGSSTESPSVPPTSHQPIETPVINKAPTDVSIVSVVSATDYINVVWNPAKDDITVVDKLVYEVHVSTVKNFTPSKDTLKRKGVDMKSAAVAGLLPDTTYFVKLVVSDLQDASTVSQEVEVKTKAKGIFSISTVVPDGGYIPAENSCTHDGGGYSLPISWSNVPEGTKSIAIIMEDVEERKRIESEIAKNPNDFPVTAKSTAGSIWYVIDIPVSVGSIVSGADLTVYPSVNRYYFTSYATYYIGACSHGYIVIDRPYKVKVYAISVDDLYAYKTNLGTPLNTSAFEKFFNSDEYFGKNILGSAELNLLYTKR